MGSGVTVIMPTYNRARYIGNSLDSLINQSPPPDRIVVVDDGSTDGTRDVLEPYMDRIEYLHKPNGGKSSALNLVLPSVETEYVWIFDDDDIAMPNALQLHLDVLENDDSVDFTYSSCQKAVFTADGEIKPGYLRRIEDLPHRKLFVMLMEECFLTHPGIMVRNRCYQALDGFDESLVRSQDYEMLLRLARRFKSAAVKEVTFIYREHPGDRGNASQSFNAADVAIKWRQFGGIILRSLYQDVDLWEYLPEVASQRNLTAGETRRALIQRFGIMMRNGLWDLALKDLSRILGESSETGPLVEEERNILRRVFENQASFQLRYDYDSGAFSKCFSQGAQPLAKEIRVELGRSIYYSFRRDLSSRNHGDAWFLLRQLLRMLGFSGMAGALAGRAR